MNKNIIEYEEFVDKLNKIVYRDVKVDIISKIANKPARYINLFRPLSVKLKLIHNILQSYEIKFGDFIEDITTDYLSHYYEILPKKAKYKKKNILFDQLFRTEEDIYMVEQKMRDDHDSTKPTGQFANFVKKINYLKEAYPNMRIKAIMWFVDADFKKQRNFYLESMKKTCINDVEMHLFYGSQLMDYLDKSEIFIELVSYLERWKFLPNDKLDINFEENWEETKQDLLNNITKKTWIKIINNDVIVKNIFPILFPTGKYMEIVNELKIEKK